MPAAPTSGLRRRSDATQACSRGGRDHGGPLRHEAAGQRRRGRSAWARGRLRRHRVHDDRATDREGRGAHRGRKDHTGRLGARHSGAPRSPRAQGKGRHPGARRRPYDRRPDGLPQSGSGSGPTRQDRADPTRVAGDRLVQPPRTPDRMGSWVRRDHDPHRACTRGPCLGADDDRQDGGRVGRRRDDQSAGDGRSDARRRRPPRR